MCACMCVCVYTRAQRMAPEIKAICEKHGVPYVQENVLMRVWRTVQVHILKSPTSWAFVACVLGRW